MSNSQHPRLGGYQEMKLACRTKVGRFNPHRGCRKLPANTYDNDTKSPLGICNLWS